MKNLTMRILVSIVMFFSSLYFFYYGLQKYLPIKPGIATLIVTVGFSSPLMLVLLDKYKGYKVKQILIRALFGVISNLGWLILSFSMVHTGLFEVFGYLTPVVSATISEFACRKDLKNKEN